MMRSALERLDPMTLVALIRELLEAQLEKPQASLSVQLQSADLLNGLFDRYGVICADDSLVRLICVDLPHYYRKLLAPQHRIAMIVSFGQVADALEADNPMLESIRHSYPHLLQ